jgi:hypothetical protein
VIETNLGIPEGYDFVHFADGLDRLAVSGNGIQSARHRIPLSSLADQPEDDNGNLGGSTNWPGGGLHFRAPASRHPWPTAMPNSIAWHGIPGPNNVMDAGSPAEAIERLQIRQLALQTGNIAGFRGRQPALTVHKRVLPDGPLYFVVNTTADQVHGTFAIPATSDHPELWQAVTGRRMAPGEWDLADGTVRMALTLAAHEALFVVPGSREASAGRLSAPARPDSAQATAHPFDGNWSVDFDQRYGEAPALSLAVLTPLEHHADERVRYYSGITTYRNSFTVNDADSVGDLQFTVAGVGDVAEVRVNGVRQAACDSTVLAGYRALGEDRKTG